MKTMSESTERHEELSNALAKCDVNGSYIHHKSEDTGFAVIELMENDPDPELFARIRQAGFVIARLLPGEGSGRSGVELDIIVGRPEVLDEIELSHGVSEKESIERMAHHWYDV